MARLFTIPKKIGEIVRRVLADRDSLLLELGLRYAKLLPCKAERLLIMARSMRLASVDSKDMKQLPRIVGQLHLAITYLDEQPRPERWRLVKFASDELKKVFAMAECDESLPLDSALPVSFVISYPRSGNTLATSLLALATEGQILEDADGWVPFSKKCFPRVYPIPRIIKSHYASKAYRKDKKIFIVRDGRDSIISLAYFTYQQKLHNFTRVEDLAKFIEWCDQNYYFGSWVQHIAEVFEIYREGEDLLVHYEDLMTKYETFVEMLVYFEDIPYEEDRLKSIYADRNSSFEGIARNSKANKMWGIGKNFENGSLFCEWSKNRQGSNWRNVWDASAKETFHRLGGTDALRDC